MKFKCGVLLLFSVVFQSALLAQTATVQMQCHTLASSGNYMAPDETYVNGMACEPVPTQASATQPASPTPATSQQKPAPAIAYTSAAPSPAAPSSSTETNSATPKEVKSAPNAALPSWDIVTPTQGEQKAYLDSLITDVKHHTGLIHSLLIKSEVNETNKRVACGGSASGTATDYSWGTDIDLSTESVCRQLADVHNETVMGVPDPAHHRAWLILAACTEGYSGGQTATAVATLGYGALFIHKHPCFMQEGPNLSVVLSDEKSGYYIYVGTTSQLGGKAKVSKYNVVEVKQFVVKENVAK